MRKDILALIHLPAGPSLKPDEQMQTALAALGERERAVLELRFGLKDGRSASLQEVGQNFGVTGERIRQIEAWAIGKLRRWALAQSRQSGHRPAGGDTAPSNTGDYPTPAPIKQLHALAAGHIRRL